MSSSGKAMGAIEMVVGILGMVFGEEIGGAEWGSDLEALGASMFFSGLFTELSLLLAPDPVTSGQDGVIRSSVANQQIVYGQIKTGGVLCFAMAYGSNGTNTNAFLTVTIAHSLTRANSAGTAGMPIQGIQGFYINDVFVPLLTGGSYGGWNEGRGSASGTGACSITQGVDDGNNEPWNNLAGNLWMSFSDGSQTTVDPIISTNFPTTVDAEFIGYGIAYSTWVMFMSADQGTFTGAFPNGINTPGTLGVVIAGQKLYDPRLDSDNGGSGSQRLTSTSTWIYSSNPALVLADYLTRAKSDGGCGYSPGSYSGSSVINSQVNWAAVAAAANICDENVVVPAYGATWNVTAWTSTEYQSRYACNMAVQTNQNCDQNVANILKTMAGWLVVAGNQIYMYAGADTSSSGTLDETFLAGPAALSPQIPRNQIYNAVKMTYGQEPQQDYNQAQGMPIINSTYETEDGGVRLWFSDTIPGCNNQFQCQILERIKSAQSRNQQILNLKCNLKALNFQGGDVVDVSLSELGLSSAPFRIMQYSLSSDYTIKMMLRAENANTFTLPATPDDVYQAYDVADYQELYNITPSAPASPTGITASATTNGNLIQWTAPAPNQYDFQTIYRSTTAGGASGYAQLGSVVGDSFTDTLITAGTTYYYYLTATNYWWQSSPTPSLPVSGASCVADVTLAEAYGSAVTGSQTNLIPDSGFKYGEVYWTATGSAYGVYIGAGANGGNQLISGPGAGSPMTAVWKTGQIPVAGSTQYTLTAQMKGGGNVTAGNPIIEAVDPGGYMTTASANMVLTNNNWNKVSVTFTTAAATTALIIKFSANSATIVSGNYIDMSCPQLELGALSTAYKSTDDSDGYSLLSGSTPTTTPTASFTYTSTTTSIDWSWSSMTWYNADGSITSVTNGSQTTTGLSANTTYYWYPYSSVASPAVTWALGGVGSPANLFTAKSVVASSTQTLAYNVPLSQGGVACTTPASGSGGGGGGGKGCLHPDYFSAQTGDKIITPAGFENVQTVNRFAVTEWLRVTLTNGETAIVTPTHFFVDPAQHLIQAKDLTVKTILQGQTELLLVTKLEYFEDTADCVALTVPCGYFFAREGGVLHKNGSGKP
ncbi:MAG: hypothetical protein WBR29_10790 [Gammaproteobacteria bacterium]